MPLKFLGFILLLACIVFFISFNIGNSSDISFGFIMYEDVPIFISLFFAFLVGVLVMIPFSLRGMWRSRNTTKSKKSKFFGKGQVKDNNQDDITQKETETDHSE